MNKTHPAWGAWLLLGLAAYFLLHTVIRATGSSVLELDEAELMVVTQWWAAGYSGQPPLYAWLQAVAFQVLGANTGSLALVKNTLLFLTYVFIYLSARRLLGDVRLAVLATLSLLLIPQIVWESQRDLSHSVMATFMAAASFHVMLRWLDRPTLFHYLLAGVVFGLGVLSKYNYLVFAAAAGLALLTLPRGRAMLLDVRILISGLAALLVTGPHLYWLVQSHDVAGRGLEKMHFGEGLWPLAGLGELLLAVIAFITPLWIVMALIFRRDFARTLSRWQAPVGPFPLQRYLLAVLLLLVIMVLLGATHFKDRWMLPMLWVFPLYVFAMMGTASLTPVRVRAYLTTCLVVPLLVLLVMAWRVNDWALLEDHQRHVHPFDALAEAVASRGFQRGIIVSDGTFVAGNLRMHFPGSQVLTPSVASGCLQCPDGGDVLLAWEANRGAELSPRMEAWLELYLGLDADHVRGDVQLISLEAWNDERFDFAVMLWAGALDGACGVSRPIQ
ncbi:ArnT family glycosyltransferase [Ectothiorhodospira variabilis]|uniref:ArnT family glycosyltransferase n=1 Tax=Ectothiorhodospira variabilis TaxID=505694 RepID=UPI001EFBB8E5|nr:glycosyltransferase family 39 protein [Ectothiorhodospira variabilis]MCG5493454.1 glycosyltransferase family 39 protein [Ectothiorhodospira variabilis]MCG5496800.1 glycosyltransferase family 39 protein [Ectothiorhodospira variabilis]MCG5502783.1 glycosyltransferase family 39 protein [Ectothiorhodospira variabilis]MCG5506429.1 glycosyltransferase family 39 protein [Ectothiorhodospira variabilis]